MPEPHPITDSQDIRRVMLRLLKTMHDEGPLDTENVIRCCLPPRQAFLALPEEERCRRTEALLDSLTELLEPNGSEVPFVVSVAQMRKAEREARAQLNWKKLPPAYYLEAKQMADKMFEHGLKNKWLVNKQMEGQSVWCLTPLGGGAIERLERLINAIPPKLQDRSVA